MLHFHGLDVYRVENNTKMSDKVLTNTFTSLRKKFLRIAMQILPSEDDAADALQDAFCRLWPRRDNIRSTAEAEALTTTTLRNICIDNVRKRKIETVTIDEEHDSCEDSSDNGYEERYKEVKKIIEKELTPQQREILQLKEIAGYTVEEIAGHLSSTESAVRMNLSRARKKIRECYRKEAQNG